MQAASTAKSLRTGEVSLVVVLAAIAFLCLFIAAKTIEPAYAFHMWLAVAACCRRHLHHLPALQCAHRQRTRSARDRRQAQLQFRARKIRFARRLVLGLRGHGGGHLHRLRARLSRAQHRPLVQLRTPASAAHFGGDLRVRRQRAAGDLVLCRAAHLPRAARRRSRAVVRGARLQLLHRDRRHGLSARHHRGQGIRRARMVHRPLADHRLGRPICWCSSARSSVARNPISSSPTGSISPSS